MSAARTVAVDGRLGAIVSSLAQMPAMAPRQLRDCDLVSFAELRAYLIEQGIHLDAQDTLQFEVAP